MFSVTDLSLQSKSQTDARSTFATRIKLAIAATALALVATAAPMLASNMIDGEVVGVNVASAENCSGGSGC